MSVVCTSFAAAVTHYEAAVAIDPSFGRAWSGLALTAFELGRTAAAEEYYAEALKHLGNMTERERLRTTGHYYAISNQNYPKAIETFRELTQKYPADDAAFNNLAVAAFFDRRFDLAFSAGANALDIYPNSSLYQGNLALYAMYSGRFEEAQVRAEALLQEQPDYAMAYLALASSAVAEAQFKQANAHYDRMAQTGPRGASIAALGKADLATYRGETDSAIAQLRAAITSDIEHANLAGTKPISFRWEHWQSLVIS